MDQRRLRVHWISAALAPCLVLAACSQDGSSFLGGSKQTAGTGIGAGVGALIGAQFGHGSGRVFSALGGGAIGALLGNYVGARLDEADRERAEAAAQRALTAHHGVTEHWSNPKTGNSGTITTHVIHYEKRTVKNTAPARATSGGGEPAPSAAPSSDDDSRQAMLDQGAPASAGASTAAVDRSLGMRKSEGGTAIACRTAVSTVKLKDQEPQVTESKFCKQPDGTWAPVES